MIPCYIILHHSATPPTTKFETVNEYHKQLWNSRSSLGFYCGYHYWIDNKGIIKQARKDNEEGIQAKGWNDKSIGICLAGDFNDYYPTEEQIGSLDQLLVILKKGFSISNQHVLGHCEINNTACPGSMFLQLIKEDRISELNVIQRQIEAIKQKIAELLKQFKKS